jgi:hypothetical protein
MHSWPNRVLRDGADVIQDFHTESNHGMSSYYSPITSRPSEIFLKCKESLYRCSTGMTTLWTRNYGTTFATSWLHKAATLLTHFCLYGDF